MATKTQMHDVDFGQRSRLALTHPVTLAGLGVLLLNDLVFKPLWSNSWTTGKLSDLAWVVFASPLLVWLLSLVVRDSRRGQRAAFVIAYIGLPLLYAAYNTFAPVHDVIIHGLSLLSGATSGSPLDPTDSLVIPVGLAVALWVWRRGVPEKGGAGTLRKRIVLLAAALATVASIATSPGPEPHRCFGASSGAYPLAGEGKVIFACYPHSIYESADGGVIWQSSNKWPERPDAFSELSIDTPRGSFEIQEYGIVHTSSDGNTRIVYSTEHLKSNAAQWVQKRATSHLPGINDGIGYSDSQEITTQPHGILYDPHSGNVIAAMGILGVVVGMPDGEWRPVEVGPYQPVNFSFMDKVRLLFGIFCAIVITLVPAVTTGFIALAGILNRGQSRLLSPGARKYVAMALSGVSFLIACGILTSFDQIIDDFDDVMIGFLATVAVILAISSFGCCVHIFDNLLSAERRSWTIKIMVGALAMIAEIFLMFVIWLQLNVATDFVVAGIIVLVIATGIVLLLYLTSPRRSESESS